MIQNYMGASYGNAHNATTNPNDRNLQQETVDAIVNLEMATASNHIAIAKITAAVARLTTELATVTAKLVVALKTNHDRGGGRGGRDITSCGQGFKSGSEAGTGTRSGAPARTGASAHTMAEEKDL